MMFCTRWGSLISYFPVKSKDCLKAFVTTDVLDALVTTDPIFTSELELFLQALDTTVSKTNYTTDRFTSYLVFIYMLTMKENCALRIRMNVITLTSQ